MQTVAPLGTSSEPEVTLNRLGLALRDSPAALLAFLERTEGERAAAARQYFLNNDRASLGILKLRESVGWLSLGRAEQAFQSAHDGWATMEGRATGVVQALVLTQLAAATAVRGDLSGAIRAARRAEALLVADRGDPSPQSLAVRAQLVTLLRHRGDSTEAAIQRRDATVTGLLAQTKDPVSLARLERLIAVFAKGDDPPSWALCYCLGWRNVHA
jgi:hypothetical protein